MADRMWLTFMVIVAAASVGSGGVLKAHAGAITSTGVEVNGTCEAGNCSPTPLAGGGNESLPLSITTTLGNGDQYQITGTVTTSNPFGGGTIATGSYYVEYVGNGRGTASQQDTIDTTVIRALAAQNSTRITTGITGTFGGGIAPASQVTASINGMPIGMAYDASTPVFASQRVSVPVTPTGGAIVFDRPNVVTFAAGSPVGSYVGYGDAAPAAIGAPTFSVSFRQLIRPDENNGFFALAVASDATGPVSLGAAATMLGVDHFNWIQLIVASPDAAFCAGSTLLTTNDCRRFVDSSGTSALRSSPFIDAPLGGYAYQAQNYSPTSPVNFPTDDYNPFYWSEYGTTAISSEYKSFQKVQSAFPSGPSGFTSASLQSAFGYLLYDDPGTINPGTERFVDFLVGVGAGCNGTYGNSACTYMPVPGAEFSWTANNDAGLMLVKDANLPTNGQLSLVNPLGCGEVICAQSISLDDALALTGNTLASFESLGVAVAEPDAALVLLCPIFVVLLLQNQKSCEAFNKSQSDA